MDRVQRVVGVTLAAFSFSVALHAQVTRDFEWSQFKLDTPTDIGEIQV